MKIVTILGARPQFVKAAVLSRIVAEHNQIEEIIVHTGQHFDNNMSGLFFDEMKIPKPKYNLNINNLGHAAMTGQMLIGIESILLSEKPIAVIVFGDTNSTLAGALAAKKLGIKVIHIEAGLRSFNMNMPEEINRIVTDSISDVLLCPTRQAVLNLSSEGVKNSGPMIIKCGDIMKDAVEFYGGQSQEKSQILERLSLKNGDFILATIHRQENTDDIEKLKGVFESLEKMNEFYEVILPLHPRTKNILNQHNLSYNITTIDPVGYFDMLSLLKHCKLVITDSGGLQKEAYFFKKHCIIAREETEWVELVENGFAEIAGSNQQKLMNAFNNLKSKKSDFSKNLYGNNVGKKIYDVIFKTVLSVDI